MQKSKLYRKKPVTVEAMEYTDDNIDDLREFIGDENIISWYKNHLILNTLEGDMIAKPGNYIIKGVEGEFYPIQSDIFHKTYEPVEGDTDAG